MPTVTFDITPENATRIIAALELVGFEREEGEADIPYFKRWVRRKVAGIVHHAEANAVMQAIVPDDGVVT